MTTPRVLVQKFGGTSVSTPVRRAQVVERVRAARTEGFAVAIVVSAMGRRGDPYATDTLLDLLRGDGGDVDPRDYDLIFGCGEAISVATMCQTLRRAGIAAHGLTGVQARIYTDTHHEQAEIENIDPTRLFAILAAGEVPVVAGAQGVIPGTLDVTTLGRGGSDTSGVAVGVALAAERVEIFTDVPGIATADPRLIPGAPVIPGLSFYAAHELARFGATVIHPRAVATGCRARMPIVVRSTFGNEPGTRIDDAQVDPPIVGLAAFLALETVVLPAGSVGPPTRDRLWRDGIPSIVDRSGRLVFGTSAGGRAELDRAVGSTPSAITTQPDLAWLSIVGDAPELSARFATAQVALGRAPMFEERDPRRLTLIVPANDRTRAAETLYQRAFDSSRTRTTGDRVHVPIA